MDRRNPVCARGDKKKKKGKEKVSFRRVETLCRGQRQGNSGRENVHCVSIRCTDSTPPPHPTPFLPRVVAREGTIRIMLDKNKHRRGEGGNDGFPDVAFAEKGDRSPGRKEDFQTRESRESDLD